MVVNRSDHRKCICLLDAYLSKVNNDNDTVIDSGVSLSLYIFEVM